ncbi:hypothetical protein ENBRE01_1958 [Enteropsectra breve]|nr:hypothetical protein ENBRE01_1958 [Enteropsectra breve]
MGLIETLLIIVCIAVALVPVGVLVYEAVKRVNRVSANLEAAYMLIKDIQEVAAYLEANEFDADTQPFTKALQTLRKMREQGLWKFAASADRKKALETVLSWENKEIRLCSNPTEHLTHLFKELIKENHANPSQPFEKFKITYDYYEKCGCSDEKFDLCNVETPVATACLESFQREGVKRIEFVFTTPYEMDDGWTGRCGVEYCEETYYNVNYKLGEYAILCLDIQWLHVPCEINQYFIPVDEDGNAISDFQYKIMAVFIVDRFSDLKPYRPEKIALKSDGTYKVASNYYSPMVVAVKRTPLNNEQPSE